MRTVYVAVITLFFIAFIIDTDAFYLMPVIVLAGNTVNTDTIQTNLAEFRFELIHSSVHIVIAGVNSMPFLSVYFLSPPMRNVHLMLYGVPATTSPNSSRTPCGVTVAMLVYDQFDIVLIVANSFRQWLR